ncbi:TSUP family transporter [Brevibacterium sp. 50QC2O2]|uniref:TSUP family transporter n=1 Tax=Brevibacterium TaxID=1696 RepID=UPI00211CDAF1|nr:MULTISPECIES: TSUP family transporter [unclassified Brevibacterium]MCQ9367746.1 TSUP family transporter [Brevibacterium sp. 91QC2O2]MCQ9384948.1 TSUP family transporter [Brevibacterium sp. 68QC2CO]MCQ9388005.1 TSUP family transporter [Brevibacterium sp. 50QC2O2]
MNAVELGPWIIVALVAGGLLAGWIDAVVGGGGLIQLPVLLLVPGMSPIQAVATNKVGSIVGTAGSTVTYLRKVKPDKSLTVPGAVFALAGAVVGAKIATLIPGDAFEPIIVLVLLGVGVFTLLKPAMGAEAHLRFGLRSKRHHALGWLLGLVVGVYDGALGPGTGSFLVIGLVALLGFSFLQASASAKIMNLATNLGALLLFVPAGHVVWAAGLAVAVGNLAGGIIGARTALRFGSGFVRIVFIVVLVVLIITLGAPLLANLVTVEG